MGVNPCPGLRFFIVGEMTQLRFGAGRKQPLDAGGAAGLTDDGASCHVLVDEGAHGLDRVFAEVRKISAVDAGQANQQVDPLDQRQLALQESAQILGVCRRELAADFQREHIRSVGFQPFHRRNTLKWVHRQLLSRCSATGTHETPCLFPEEAI